MSKLHIGSYCLGQFSIDSKSVISLFFLMISIKCGCDGRWYRAQILERQGDECYVLFIDHGEDEWLNVSNIRPISPHMLSVSHCTPCIVPLVCHVSYS